MKRNFKVLLISILAVTALISVAWAGSRSLAWLGVVTQEVDRDIARDFDLKVRSGAIINEIVADSPADKAGLTEDDIIILFNDEKVRDDDDLTDLIQDSRPGDSVTLTVIRDGAEKKIPVELGRRSRSRSWTGNWDWYEAPRVPAVPPIPSVPHAPRAYSIYFDDRPYIGVTLVELSEDAARALGASKGGVLIDAVENDSPAETAGLKAGDLLVAIDSEEVFDAEDVQDIIQDLDDGDTVKLELVRDHKPLTVNVKVEFDESHSSRRKHGVIRLPDLPDLYLSEMGSAREEYRQALDEYRDGQADYREAMKEVEREMEKVRQELREVKKSAH